MNSTNEATRPKIGLISMPWALFNRPSIQLGALSAYVKRELQLDVDCFHPYLLLSKRIGSNDYQQISLKPWAGESLFAALLYPENTSNCREVYYQCLKGKDISPFTIMVQQVKETIDDWLNTIAFDRYSLVGFSVCFDQLFASLYAAQWIRSRHPQVRIVFGGSSCCQQVGVSLVQNFAQIDHIVDGEGELALCELIQMMNQENEEKIPAVIRISSDKKLDINNLPVPDFSHYFKDLAAIFPNRPFEPMLPVEFSRGCWWGKCTFCNLNIQWTDYRAKQAETVATEIATHHASYDALDFTFTDNALPPKEADRFFTAASDQEKDFTFFAEIRAITSEQRIEKYRAGGLNSVQVGIEAFSDSLLKKMQKGVRTIDNIAVMKYCLDHGVSLDGNIITHFPTSTAEEVAETLEALDFVLPYHPLSTAKFFLGYGSPVEQNPAQFGLTTRKHRFNRLLYPDHLRTKLVYLVRDYTGDKGLQEKLWKDIGIKVTRWQNFHQHRKESRCALSYRDGGNFLLIRQEQVDKEVLRHKLKGVSRQLYLFCNTPQTLSSILETFDGLSKEKLVPFFQDLHKKRILYFDGTRALALAVHQS